MDRLEGAARPAAVEAEAAARAAARAAAAKAAESDARRVGAEPTHAPLRVVVLEIGCGGNVPTVRCTSEVSASGEAGGGFALRVVLSSARDSARALRPGTAS